MLTEPSSGTGHSTSGGSTRFILTSPDGITWTEQDSGKTGTGNYNNLQGVLWTGKILVAWGAKNEILTSLDGNKWTSLKLDGFLGPIAWTGTRFVSVGGVGNIMTSLDAANWTRSSHKCRDETRRNCVVWTGKQLVAVGIVNYKYGCILTSPDGQTWVERFLSNKENRLHSVTWTGSQLVAVGNWGLILTSPDGLQWSQQSLGFKGGFEHIVWTGSQLVAVGSSALLSGYKSNRFSCLELSSDSYWESYS